MSMSEEIDPRKGDNPELATAISATPETRADLEATASGGSSSTTVGFETTPVPKIIGPYKLLHRLGEGGMGQVWLAEQTAPVQREVALKLIRIGLYDHEHLQRFFSERQSLATMDHPA